mmetsp:Transcript_32090/g.89828  ORF Transcript_32090/g.89828 Transcript_32090/m.89828 type:complete len:317 (+) Transcript_32090:1692-2642(+)
MGLQVVSQTGHCGAVGATQIQLNLLLLVLARGPPRVLLPQRNPLHRGRTASLMPRLRHLAFLQAVPRCSCSGVFCGSPRCALDVPRRCICQLIEQQIEAGGRLPCVQRFVWALRREVRRCYCVQEAPRVDTPSPEKLATVQVVGAHFSSERGARTVLAGAPDVDAEVGHSPHHNKAFEEPAALVMPQRLLLNFAALQAREEDQLRIAGVQKQPLVVAEAHKVVAVHSNVRHLAQPLPGLGVQQHQPAAVAHPVKHSPHRPRRRGSQRVDVVPAREHLPPPQFFHGGIREPKDGAVLRVSYQHFSPRRPHCIVGEPG